MGAPGPRTSVDKLTDTARPATAEPRVRRPRGRPRKRADEQDDGNRRRELMDEAARLFLTRGFAATSTRDIAAAVGMHAGSPYYHFKSKSALLHAVMAEGMTAALQSQQHTLALRSPATTARDRLRVLIRHHFEILLGPHSGFIPVMLYEWRSLSAAQKKDVARIKDAYEAAWMPALEELARTGALRAEPRVARLYIFGALNWAVTWFSPRKGRSLDALAEEALALFIGQG
jgi:AcrR family transcriptional regulator